MIVLSISSSRLKESGVSSDATSLERAEFIQSQEWSFGKAALKETVLAFAYGPVDSLVHAQSAWEVEIIEVDGKIRLGGKMIPLGWAHPARNTDIIVTRNPVSYVTITSEEQTCACGCGGELRRKSTFLPGHDQRAIHDRIKRYFGGSTLKAIHELDRVFGEENNA